MEPPVLAHNGAIPVPTTPGLGYAPIEERIREHTLRTATLTA
jgi:L-alanine-DL-glutamate epimerase-like enolase superfamily enzyme